MTDEELLAAMRAQYKYATLEKHMLVDGIVYARCLVCLIRHVPREAGSVRWCDPCVDECLETRETPEEFVTRKRRGGP
jgi:hypothetical protein